MRASWLKTEKTQKEEGAMASYIGTEGARREPHPAPSMDKRLAQHQGEGKFVPLDAGGTASP
jgi:hypothetical protein